jgi:hypothetical protein
VLVALAPAVVVSVAVGATLTTFSSYWNAVWGMVAGAAVFALISGVETSRALREADYLGYSAF